MLVGDTPLNPLRHAMVVLGEAMQCMQKGAPLQSASIRRCTAEVQREPNRKNAAMTLVKAHLF